MYADYNINVNLNIHIESLNSKDNTVLNLDNHGFKFNGEDETEKLKEIINNSENKLKVIIIPSDKTLTIGNLKIDNDNFIIRNYGKIKIGGCLQMEGNNSGIEGGIIEGNLKIAQLAENAVAGETTLKLDNNPFKEGDTVYIRKSLGALDGIQIKPKVISSNGNEITVDTPLTEDTLKNSYIGNYNWNSTISFKGKGDFLTKCKLINCPGYAINVKGILNCNNVTIDKNGMDMISLEGELYADNLNLGYSYADSTQGISILKDNSVLSLERSRIKRNNCDSDVYIYQELKGVKCRFVDCDFDGKYKSDVCFRPSGKDKGGNSILEMAIVRNATQQSPIQSVDTLYFERCRMDDYNLGIIHLYKAQNLDNIYEINSYINNKCHFRNIGIITNNSSMLKVNKYEFNSCEFLNDKYYDTSFLYSNKIGNMEGNIIFNECSFNKIFKDQVDSKNTLFNNCTVWVN